MKTQTSLLRAKYTKGNKDFYYFLTPGLPDDMYLNHALMLFTGFLPVINDLDGIILMAAESLLS